MGGPTPTSPVEDLVLGGAGLSQTQDGDGFQLVVPMQAWEGGELSLEVGDDGMLDGFQYIPTYRPLPREHTPQGLYTKCFLASM